VVNLAKEVALGQQLVVRADENLTHERGERLPSPLNAAAAALIADAKLALHVAASDERVRSLSL
jgi:hypothetical protein